MTSWLKSKVFGSSAAAAATPTKAQREEFEDDEEEQERERVEVASAKKAPRQSGGGATLSFAPDRPPLEQPAVAWKLPADALGGGSEVARAVVSLYMQTAGQPMQLKFKQCLLLLIKLAPYTYEFKVCGEDKVLIAQPLLPSLTFYFKPVSRPSFTAAAAEQRASGQTAHSLCSVSLSVSLLASVYAHARLEHADRWCCARFGCLFRL